MKRFHASTLINASPETIWPILTDAASYPAWNSTVTRVEGNIAPGKRITVHAKVQPTRDKPQSQPVTIPFPVKVSEFDAPKTMIWTGGMPFGLFKGERVFTLSPKNGATEFSMTETFSGPLAGLIGKSIPDLQPAFDEFAACLKRRAEQTS